MTALFDQDWSTKGGQNKQKIEIGTSAYSIAPQIEKNWIKISSKNIIFQLELVSYIKMVVPILLQQIFSAYSIAPQHVLALKNCAYSSATPCIFWPTSQCETMMPTYVHNQTSHSSCTCNKTMRAHTHTPGNNTYSMTLGTYIDTNKQSH